jgi:hypothetical protein
MKTTLKFALAGALLAASCAAASAQQAPTVRLRGTIEKVDGQTLTLKTTGGEAKLSLTADARIVAVVKATLAEVKEGTFLGSAAMPQPDGTQKAFAVHIFMDSQKGVVADRFSDWDSRPGSTMTNANVATTVSGKDGQDLLVKYKDGEKKVQVPPGIPIARYVPGTAADLKVGAKIFIGAAQRQPDGSLNAPNVAVGRDIDPPQ